ncbi:hypothetical protein SAMN04490182_2097 [Pseudomonas cedrina]|uniref:Uncharacterized protein n=2 Tax=Pseudomonas cedrina TaxID=651740 RepID=A0A1V2K2B0_PSECE|nr:hypothetical protein [Pseudomonas cedrina]ONH51001.1 hypothetical protein BLL36_24125 [Pseudomonas cedrina subsp. cedrina]SDS67201.1 hypothetical protein SAMN04490182_2097 [Pseudomonas cedrina]
MRMLFNPDGFVVNLADEIDIDEYAVFIGGTIVEMVSERPSDRHQALISGEWQIPMDVVNAENAFTENEWRDSQMPKAQQNVTAIEYGEEGIPGTAQQWQKYWLALRKWTADNPDFPDSTKRPIAPS